MIVDAKEQELIEARDAASREWAAASREMAEAYRKRCEADRKRDDADSKLRKYRESKAR